LSNEIVRLDQKGDPAEIYCPVCGRPVFENEFEETICTHVLFTYADPAGSFGFVREDLKELAEGAEEYSSEWDVSPVDVLVLSVNRPDAFCLAVTTSGIACGPVSGTAYVGFMFAPEQE
jgi:hypothetical protein